MEKCENLGKPSKKSFCAESVAMLGDPHVSGLRIVTACSACAGDYEDPDRTAWPVAEMECEDGDPSDVTCGAPGEEFSADE